MIEGWEEKSLGDVIAIKYGKDHKRLGDGSIPCYGSGGVMRYVDEELSDEPSILIPRKGSLNNIFYTDFPFWTVDTLFWSEIDFSQINAKFLYYQLSQIDFTTLNVGSAVPSLTVPVLEEVAIKSPSLSEQEAIAEILSSLDDKIDLLHRQNATLEAFAETLFRQNFIEEAQDDWAEAKVSDLANHHKVTVKPQANPDTLYHHYSLPAFDDGREAHSEHGRDIRSGKYQVPDNSVLISKLNPEVSRVWLVGKQTHEANICSTEFQVAKPVEPVNLPFVYCLLKSRMMRDELTASAGGTSKSHQRVKPADIFEFAFLRPPSELIEAFAGQTMPMLEKLLDNQEQIQTLEKLRDTLLPKLMSGEVRVALDREAA